MASEYRVIDADGHVLELGNEVIEYMPAPFDGIWWHDSYSMWPGWDGYVRGMRKPGGHVRHGDGPNAQDWLNFIDANCIEKTVIYPTQGLTLGVYQDVDFAVALARAYNDWMYDRFMRISPRLISVALLPIQDVEESVKELRRCVNELGMPGAVIPSVVQARPYFGDPSYYPLWEACQELDVPIAPHSGTAAYLGLDGLQNQAAAHCLEHPFAQQRQFTHMMFEGVFELFPKLRVAVLECGAGWVPWMMDRMDEEVERKGRFTQKLRKKPSDYFRDGNIFFTAEVEESTLPFVAERVRPDILLWASDFPHERDVDEFGGDIPTLSAREDVPDAVKRAIFFENPCRLYGFDANGDNPRAKRAALAAV
jgi:predicted TIM-barrel fold metal-dependent hydrolase